MTTVNNDTDEGNDMEVNECLTCGGSVAGSSLLCGNCYREGQQKGKRLPPAEDGGHRYVAP